MLGLTTRAYGGFGAGFMLGGVSASVSSGEGKFPIVLRSRTHSLVLGPSLVFRHIAGFSQVVFFWPGDHQISLRGGQGEPYLW